MIFADRVEAGQQLAVALERFRGPDTVVLGLPRGGVPVARQIADALDAPLDVIVVRKLGAPTHHELAMGAIGEGGVRVVSDDIVRSVGATEQQIAAVEAAERDELERRAVRFRGARPRLDLTGKTAIVVDDGIATGATARPRARWRARWARRRSCWPRRSRRLVWSTASTTWPTSSCASTSPARSPPSASSTRISIRPRTPRSSLTFPDDAGRLRAW